MLFHDNDFLPILSHHSSDPLIETWLSVFTEDALQEISLFLPETAQILENRILPFCQSLSVYAIQETGSLPSEIESFEQLKRLVDTVRSEEETRSWLMNLGILPQSRIILSCDFNTALLISWDLFTRYYDDFCYYGGYDICIYPVDERWGLLYYHEDVFLFGKRRI